MKINNLYHILEKIRTCFRSTISFIFDIWFIYYILYKNRSIIEI